MVDYFVSFLETFMDEGALAHFVDSVHMNDQGYRFLAESIARFLIEEEIVLPDKDEHALFGP